MIAKQPLHFNKNQKKIIYDDEPRCSTSDCIDKVKREHQKQFLTKEYPIKTSFQKIFLTDDKINKEVMTKCEIDELRNSVLRINRPINPWFDYQHLIQNDNCNSAKHITEVKNVKNNLETNTCRNALSKTKPINLNSEKNFNEKKLNYILKHQKSEEEYKKQQNYNYDISVALASDIKMLEQLELEHKQRINNRFVLNKKKADNFLLNNKTDVANYNTKIINTNINLKQFNTKNLFNAEVNDENEVLNTTCDTNKKSYFKVKTLPTLSCTKKNTSKELQINDSEFIYKKIDEKNLINKKNSFSKEKNFNNIQNVEVDKIDKIKTNTTFLPICFTCNIEIKDVILQALGKKFHPECFRCSLCFKCLDGIPFAVDNNKKVYCLNDYQKIFVSMCNKCFKPIPAINEFGQTIQLIFQNNEYHIDCFKCEECGIQLSNERHNRCYPIFNNLLCRKCHLQWKCYINLNQPITDL